MEPDFLQPGRTLLHYRLVEKIGEGGMGVVWRAVDTSLDREVAIKMLPPGWTGDEQRRARFVREAKLLASLSHPNIAGIYQVEQVDDAQLLVMEMVEGETLAERLARGRLSTEEALRVALQMTLALEEAHERGIVHRDLKPANVKLTPKDEVKILDFGLAKALEDEPGAPGSQTALTHSPTLTAQMTGAGMLLGTAAYMSPEQARGDPADRRADIWAFGVVLMEMLTGKTVYAGKTAADTLAGVLAREPTWDELPDRTPPSVRRLLERCLQKELRDRLQAIGEARLVIEAYLADPDADVAPVGTALRPAWRAALPWVLVAVLAAVAGLSWLRPTGGAGSASGAPRTLRVGMELPQGQRLFRGYGASAVLSPDGTRIVYGIDSVDRRELYVRALDQWEGILLQAGEGSDRPYQPFFSPDGQWIGFVTWNALKKIPVTGGTAITLTELGSNRGSSWGEDGRIVFSKSNTGLHRVSAAGGEPETLTELDEAKGELSHRWPQILPGGRTVLFTTQVKTEEAEQWNVELLDLASGERRLLRRDGIYARYLASGHIAYVSDGTLYAVPFDLERLEVTGSAAPVTSGVSFNQGQGSAQYSVSDNGHLAYVTGTNENDRLQPVWVDRAGRFEILWDSWQSYRSPALSPDGKRLAVVVKKDDQSDIWVYDIERQVPTRVTFDDAADTGPTWTPDGRFIVFSSERDGSFNIYRKRSNGAGEVERLTRSELEQHPASISPDGKLLGFSEWSRQRGWDAGLMPLDGSGEPVGFGTAPFSEAHPVFSPDGRFVAYFTNESGEWEVHVRDVAGSGKWQISNGGGAWPLWSPDGRELFYWWNSRVHVVDVETKGEEFRAGRSRVLFEGVLTDLWNRRPWDITPDGERFVGFRREALDQDKHEHVQLVLHWFDELERTFAAPQP